MIDAITAADILRLRRRVLIDSRDSDEFYEGTLVILRHYRGSFETVTAEELREQAVLLASLVHRSYSAWLEAIIDSIIACRIENALTEAERLRHAWYMVWYPNGWSKWPNRTASTSSQPAR